MVDKDETPNLKSENEELRKRVAKLEAETIDAMGAVKDSADAIVQMQDEKAELEKKAKEPLVRSLVKDSLGHFNEADLDKLTLDALHVLRVNFENEVGAAYHDWLVARQQRDEARARARKTGTIGTYNQDTGKWENGTDEGVV